MFFLVASERFGDHLTPPGHPDRPTRAHVMDAIAADAAARGIAVIAPQPALLDDLLRIHAAEYVDRVAGGGQAARLAPDTFTSPDSADVARLAAGAAVDAVERVLRPSRPAQPEVPRSSSVAPAALVMSRPPGHHAARDRAMGFCIYNSVAIAAAHALASGLDRVAIVDYDVHHGNGTQSLFYDDPRVLFVSTHQYPFYPGTGPAADTGAGAGEGFTFNVPIEAGATDGDYAEVFDRLVVPVIEAYRPQLVLASAGFDAHMRDPMARMRLSVNGLRRVAATLRDTSVRLSVPIVFVTEGGYHLRALGACLDSLVRLLAADDVPAPDPRRTTLTGLKARPANSTQGDLAGRGLDPTNGRASADDDPLTVEEAPLIEEPIPEVTHRGPASVDLVRAAQKRHWPTL